MPYGSRANDMSSGFFLALDIVILACAVSAGIHGALVAGHYDEGAGAGIAFALATVLLGLSVAVLTRRPSRPALAATAALLAGLIAAYCLAITTGIPVIHADREAVDGLALFTKAAEALGLVVACSLVVAPSPRRFHSLKGQIT